MKKKLVASLAAAMVLGVAGTSFAAANPFADVPAKHWAYDSVLSLEKAGLADGYGDGTFKGDKLITRYEMAQIVAKAMARSDKADATQKAAINKLATEFAEELNVIGVRVTTLEKNQANLKFNGTVDMRYTDKTYSQPSDVTNAKSFNTKTEEYRLRLDATAAIDKNNTFGMRFTNGITQAGAGQTGVYTSGSFTGLGAEQAAATKGQVTLDRLFITSKIGAITTTIGEQAIKLGTDNFIVDSGAYNFDGISARGKIGTVNLVSQWGQQQKTSSGTTLNTTVDVASLEALSTIGKLNYGFGYATLKNNGSDHSVLAATIAKYEYGNAAYVFNNKFGLGGEYVKNASDAYTVDQTAWNVSATLGDQVLAKKGQNNLVVRYYNVGKNSITRLSTFDLQDKAVLTTSQGITDVKNVKAFNVTYNYAFSKNMLTYVMYEKVTDKDATAATDMGYKFIRVGVTAKF